MTKWKNSEKSKVSFRGFKGKHIMKRFAILLFIFIGSFIQVNGAKQLSVSSKVVLFTCGPGVELYAGFGHSALWIYDTNTKTDRLYNYGTFDFNTPHFYSKFTRGQLDYMLSATSVRRFLMEYNYRKIKVDGQTLNLALDERQRLYEILEENLQPENRFYRYDFFYDNCATRLWDVVEEATGGRVQLTKESPDASFRELLFPYLEHKPWVKMGINLVLGLAADKEVSARQAMYLPLFLYDGFESATFNDGRKLVQSEREYVPEKLTFDSKWYLHPITILSVLLLVVFFVSRRELKKGKTYRWLDTVLMSISVLAGVFILFMWLGTDHSATNFNLNFLWMIPAQLVFLLGRNKKSYVLLSLIYSLVIIVVMLVWPQEIEVSFILIAWIFVVRFGLSYLKLKK